MPISQINIANEGKGRDCLTAPKEQATFFVNLSGKRTLAGRVSGECFFMETTKEDNLLVRLNFQVQGQRTTFIRGPLSFFIA